MCIICTYSAQEEDRIDTRNVNSIVQPRGNTADALCAASIDQAAGYAIADRRLKYEPDFLGDERSSLVVEHSLAKGKTSLLGGSRDVPAAQHVAWRLRILKDCKIPVFDLRGVQAF